MDEPTLDAPPEPQEALPGIGVCPYLVSSAGPWRSAEAARDHRCSMAPRGTRLELDHQRRYCLGTGGPGCPRYVPARAPGRLVSTLPVVVDRGPLGAALEPDGLRRFAAPASVVIVGAALGAFLLARGPGAPGPGPGAGGSAAGPTVRPSTSPATSPPSPTLTAQPSHAPSPTAPPPTPAPLASASPRPGPSASPAPVAGRTYTVRPGDTLYAIAAKFGTTPRALVQLNGIADPSFIRVGQVLKLP
jgi:hypothetical protein